MRDAQLGSTDYGGIQVTSISMVHCHLQACALGSELSAVKDANAALETLKEDLLAQLAMKDEELACIGTSLSVAERQRTEAPAAATAAGTKLAAAQGKLAELQEQLDAQLAAKDVLEEAQRTLTAQLMAAKAECVALGNKVRISSLACTEPLSHAAADLLSLGQLASQEEQLQVFAAIRTDPEETMTSVRDTF